MGGKGVTSKNNKKKSNIITYSVFQNHLYEQWISRSQLIASYPSRHEGENKIMRKVDIKTKDTNI